MAGTTSATEATIASIDDLGEGYGFRKARAALGIEAFGANVIVTPPGHEGKAHFHTTQDELYFVHAGTARFEFAGQEPREVGPGGLVHVPAAVHRRYANVGDDDLVLLVVGGAGGYVERDGQLVDIPQR
jgi:mannose-6-phosphate isomerase-like protein (cupin superfamily)